MAGKIALEKRNARLKRKLNRLRTSPSLRLGGFELLGKRAPPTLHNSIPNQRHKPDESEPIIIPKMSSALKLLMHARDEAHRFAVSFHRNRRGKRMVLSDLDNIPGIGPKRRQILIKKYGSVEKIKASPLEELVSVSGIGREIGEQIHRYFHGGRV